MIEVNFFCSNCNCFFDDHLKPYPKKEPFLNLCPFCGYDKTNHICYGYNKNATIPEGLSLNA